MNRDLSRDYQALTPHERFQLIIRALARGDEDEAERLGRTCPKKTYEMNDAAFADRFDALNRLVAAFLMQTEQANGKLVLHGVAETLIEHILKDVDDAIHSAYYRGFSDGGGQEEPDSAAEELIEEQIQGIRALANKMLATTHQAIMNCAKSDFEAFDAVCQERLGLDVETVIAGMELGAVLAWLDREELEASEPAEPSELIAMFIDAWDRNIASDPNQRADHNRYSRTNR